jgi:hypothetical protein
MKDIKTFDDFLVENETLPGTNINVSDMMKHTTRAEAFLDVVNFLALIEPEFFITNVSIDNKGVNGVNFSFESNATKKQVMGLLKQVPDGHVMARSLK